MASTLCAASTVMLLSTSQQSVSSSRLSAKRHRHPGPHKGHPHSATTARPPVPDSFSAPFSSSKVIEVVDQDKSAEVQERGSVQNMAEEQKTCWVENLKGQAFWVLRTLATSLD